MLDVSARARLFSAARNTLEPFFPPGSPRRCARAATECCLSSCSNRRAGLAAFALHAADVVANQSRERFERVERLERALRRTSAAQRDLMQLAGDLAERLGPAPDEPTVSLESILAELPAPNPARAPGAAGTAAEEEFPLGSTGPNDSAAASP